MKKFQYRRRSTIKQKNQIKDGTIDTDMDTARSEQKLVKEKTNDHIIFDFSILEYESYKAY